MKVVTVRQPFASLIAAGAKTLLDQARPTGYRGRLLIRSAMAKPPARWRGGGYAVRGYGTVGFALTGPGLPEFRSTPRLEGCLLPRGVVVASCELVNCVPVIEKFSWLEMQRHGALVSQRSGGLFTFHRRGEPSTYRKLDDQFPLGDFAPGRHVWLLDDVRPTTERCPRCWRVLASAADPIVPCTTCAGRTTPLVPVRMRGGPGLRTPEWEET